MEYIHFIELVAAINLIWIACALNTNGFYATVLFKVCPTITAVGLTIDFLIRMGYILKL